MKKLFVTLLAFVLVLSFTLTACSCSGDDKLIYTDIVTLECNAEGEYSCEVKLDEENDIKFVEQSKLDSVGFSLSGSYSGGENADFTIQNYSITRVSDKTLKVQFKAPMQNMPTVKLSLYAESGVTSDDGGLSVNFNFYEPDAVITAESAGCYYGSKEMTVNLTLGGENKFVSELTADMFTLPIGLNAKLSVVRLDDTNAKLTISGETYLSSEYFDIIVSSKAIDSPYASDVTLNIEYAHPYLIEGERKLTDDYLSVTGTAIPEGFSGVENGISLVLENSLVEIKSQSYNEEANTYSYKIGISKIGISEKAVAGGYTGKMSDLLDSIVIGAVLKSGNDTINYAFSAKGIEPYMSASTSVDYDSHKITVSLSLTGGEFVTPLKKEDLTLTGDGVSKFNITVENSTANGLDIVFAYEPEETGYVLDLLVDASKVNGAEDDFIFSLFLPCYEEAKEIDWSALGKSVGTSVAGSIAGAASDFALPYIYDFFGIDTSYPQMNAIQKSINELTSKVDDISNDIQNISGYIEQSTNLTFLNDFQSKQNILLSTYRTIFSSEDVINYVKAFGDFDWTTSSQKLVEQEAAKKAFAEFKAILSEVYSDYISAETTLESLFLIPLEKIFNQVVYNTHNAGDMYLYDDLTFHIGAISITSHEPDYATGIKLYDLCKGAYELDYSLDSITTPSEEATNAFVQKIEGLKISDGYVASVLNYGSQIISTSMGLKDGIIGIYFDGINNIYNFESQTINAKKAFISLAQNVYFANAAIALQYCSATNDGNKTAITNQIMSVFEVLDAKFNEISAMETRAKAGEDIILITGTQVSKTMKAIDLNTKSYNSSTDGKTDFESFASISQDSMYNMYQRAAARGLSLAQDLTSAGFSNITKNQTDTSKGAEYVYMCSGYSAKYDEVPGGKQMLQGLTVGFWANGKIHDGDMTMKSNFLEQTGKNAAVRKKDFVFFKSEHYCTGWTHKWSYKYTRNYSVIIGFVAA